MERLLDLYIGREIGPEEYQRKKAKFLNDKQALKEKIEEIEKGGGGWLEPAKAFLTSCNHAYFVAWQENPPAQKAFLKNLGSNFVLKDRTLSFSYASPFHLVAQSDPQKNWLPFVQTYRTLCLVPTPEMKAVFNDFQQLGSAT